MASLNQVEPRLVGFVCNWGAYSGLEMAGINRRQYPASVKLVKVMCLGRLHLGLLLKAFELGADGVMLLGCSPEECHYESGEPIRDLMSQARKTMRLLGIEANRLAFIEVPVGRDDILVKQVSAFAKRISRTGRSPIASAAHR